MITEQLWESVLFEGYIDGLVQDCSNSSALAMELLQSCTKPSIYAFMIQMFCFYFIMFVVIYKNIKST